MVRYDIDLSGKFHQSINSGEDESQYDVHSEFQFFYENDVYKVKRISDDSIVLEITQKGVAYIVSDGIHAVSINIHPIVSELSGLHEYIVRDVPVIDQSLCKTMEFIYSIICT